MVWQRLAVTALTMLTFASGSLLAAQPDQLDALARELSLNDRQKQQVRQIYADFDRKANPLIQQLCTHRDEEWQALQKILSEGGRAKLNEALKAQEAKELQSIAQKLNLTEEQKERVEKIRKDFWKKFQNVCAQKGENMAREYRHAYMEAVGAAREVVRPGQFTKLSAIQKEDFHEGHDFAVRQAHLNAMADQLGLSADQRNQIKQHCATCEKKCEQPQAEFKQLCKEECAALEKVLNADQRAKLHQIFPFSFLAEE
jgi:protein-disulfide isomerase-like protein with CxxC motif